MIDKFDRGELEEYTNNMMNYYQSLILKVEGSNNNDKVKDKDTLSIKTPASAGANVPTRVITPKSRAVAGNNNLLPESSFTNPILLGT